MAGMETTRAAGANTNNSNLYLYYLTLHKGLIEAKSPPNLKKKLCYLVVQQLNQKMEP